VYDERSYIINAAFADSQCSTEILWGCGENVFNPGAVVEVGSSRTRRRPRRFDPDVRYAVVGDRAPMRHYYHDDAAECYKAGSVGDQCHMHRIGKWLSLADFSSGSEPKAQQSGARLRLRTIQSADAARVPYDYWDSHLGTPCRVSTIQGARKCLPHLPDAYFSQSVAYVDTECDGSQYLLECTWSGASSRIGALRAHFGKRAGRNFTYASPAHAIALAASDITFVVLGDPVGERTRVYQVFNGRCERLPTGVYGSECQVRKIVRTVRTDEFADAAPNSSD
jgi:hypothetical protein